MKYAGGVNGNVVPFGEGTEALYVVEMVVRNKNGGYALYRDVVIQKPLLYGSGADSDIYQNRFPFISEIIAVSAASA